MIDDLLLSMSRRSLLAGLGTAATSGVTASVVEWAAPAPARAQESKSVAVVRSILARKFTISIFAATIGASLLVASAAPGFAQSYCACNGTGNVIDTPLLEKTNGAYGYEMSVPPRGSAPASAYAGQRMTGKSAYAYSPAVRSSSRHMKHDRRR